MLDKRLRLLLFNILYLTGMHFITEDDLKMVPGMNMKLFVKKIIPMLRHCAVLKELHKSGISYYVIPS